MTAVQLPPTSELFTRTALAERHPNILTPSRVSWALRHREQNGLADTQAVFQARSGDLLIHEPTFLTWFLGLGGRAKPRAARRAVDESPAGLV